MWLGFELLAVGSTLRAIWIAWLVVVGLGFGVAEVRRCCGGGGKVAAKAEPQPETQAAETAGGEEAGEG